MTRLRQVPSLALILTLSLTLIPRVHAQAPPEVGDVQRLPVITLSLQVGMFEKDSRQVVYSPPPGWYVRSHSVEVIRKTGNSSYTVATVPRNWGWTSEEKVADAYRVLMELAARAADQGLLAKFAQEREQTLLEIRRVRASHHALVVDATARGEGFLRGGGSLELTILAELVFIGTNESLDRTVAQHRSKLEK
jgi:hypothetical protein